MSCFIDPAQLSDRIRCVIAASNSRSVTQASLTQEVI